MGLKILHSADWHLDTAFTGFSEQQRQFLKREQRKLPGKITDLCLREDCDMMLLAGDLFDGEPSRETVDTVKKELARCGVPVLIAPGNHDFCTPGSLWLEETWPENVFVFTGDLESVTIQGLSCRIYGGAFRSMDCPALLEDFRAQGEETYRVAVLHGDPLQRNSPYNPITNAQVRGSGLQYLALGHIHKAGAFRSGRTMCAWPGCPMGRGWDETGEKGVCIVNVGEETTVRAVSVQSVRFYDLTVIVEEDAASAVEAVLPAVPGHDFYRITLTGEGNVNLPELRNRFSGFPNLELRDRTEAPLEVWAEADKDTLEGIYFGMLRKALAENPDKANEIQLAAEISRKLLGGREVRL
jgi:DNA repair exonuclease SbcCD nuclease subunit